MATKALLAHNDAGHQLLRDPLDPNRDVKAEFRGGKRKLWCKIITVFLLIAAAVTGITLLAVFLLSRNVFPGLPPTCAKNCTTFDHSLWTTFLNRYTTSGTLHGFSDITIVEYGKVMQEKPHSLTTYLNQLASAPLEKLDEVFNSVLISHHSPHYPSPLQLERKTLFINAYNAFAINMVVSHPCSDAPCESIR